MRQLQTCPTRPSASALSGAGLLGSRRTSAGALAWMASRSALESLMLFLGLYGVLDGLKAALQQGLDLPEGRIEFGDAPHVPLVVAVLHPPAHAHAVLVLPAHEPALEDEEHLHMGGEV